MGWSKTNGRSLLSEVESGGKSEWDWGQKRKIRLKNTIETDKEKIKQRKQERKKRSQLQRLKAAEKLVLPNPFVLINNKASNVLDAEVEKNHKNLETKDVVNL